MRQTCTRIPRPARGSADGSTALCRIQPVNAETAGGVRAAFRGESLLRPPRGFDKEHECIADIKRKSFIAVKNMDVKACLDPRFQQQVETAFKSASPYMKFLCKAVGVPF